MRWVANTTLRGVDAPLGRLYRGGVWLLFTRPALAILALLSVAGLAAFFLGADRVREALAATKAAGWLLLAPIPASIVALVLHEAGHAFATKHFGREVNAVGVGWYWFGPVAYVDTSDMWLAGRGQRLAVNLAGLATNVALAGAAALGAYFSPNPVVAAVLWQFALAEYVTVLANLKPLLELDGYFVLIDALERPNLRPCALAWLGTRLVPTLRERGLAALRGHGLELGYGLAALGYIAVEGVLVVALYRVLVQGWLAPLLPAGVVGPLGWVFAAVAIALTLAGVLADLRGAHAPRATRA